MSGLLVKSDLCKELIVNLFRTGAGSVPVDLEKKKKSKYCCIF